LLATGWIIVGQHRFNQSEISGRTNIAIPGIDRVGLSVIWSFVDAGKITNTFGFTFWD
jgi:hypothetical protein